VATAIPHAPSLWGIGVQDMTWQGVGRVLQALLRGCEWSYRHFWSFTYRLMSPPFVRFHLFLAALFLEVSIALLRFHLQWTMPIVAATEAGREEVSEEVGVGKPECDGRIGADDEGRGAYRARASGSEHGTEHATLAIPQQLKTSTFSPQSTCCIVSRSGS